MSLPEQILVVRSKQVQKLAALPGQLPTMEEAASRRLSTSHHRLVLLKCLALPQTHSL